MIYLNSVPEEDAFDDTVYKIKEQMRYLTKNSFINGRKSVINALKGIMVSPSCISCKNAKVGMDINKLHVRCSKFSDSYEQLKEVFEKDCNEQFIGINKNYNCWELGIEQLELYCAILEDRSYLINKSNKMRES